MKLLLDTHVWLWGLLEPERLSRTTRRSLVHADNELWLSSVSVWESMVLAERGKIRLAQPAEDWIAEALSTVACNEIPVTNAIAITSRAISLPHQDPADRFIAASAQVFDLTLVTADARLLACSEIKTRAA